MLVVTGAVAFDHIFVYPGRFADHILPEKIHVINISVVVDNVDRRFGGTGGNQAYTLGLLGMKPILLASAGYDFDPYEKYLLQAAVDTRYIAHQADLLTTSAFALTDRSDNQIWGFAKNAMIQAKKLSFKTIKEPVDFVLITPDEYTAVVNYVDECLKQNISYAFDPAFDIPKLSPEDLRRGVLGSTILFGNDYEIAQLKKRTRLSHEVLTDKRIVVTTYADKGSVIEKGSQKVTIKAAKAKKFVSPTGAGDAYRSGFLAGYLRGYDLKVCGQMGSVAAVYAIEHPGTIEHKFTKEEFIQRYKENYGEMLIL